jgi:hypothetical protein
MTVFEPFGHPTSYAYGRWCILKTRGFVKKRAGMVWAWRRRAEAGPNIQLFVYHVVWILYHFL